jgi:putative spermidine/putrescine transport system ATP-binding protein
MRPRTAFVASFVGSANVVAGTLAQRVTGTPQPFAIRPELIELALPGATAAAATGTASCEGRLEQLLYHGASTRCHVRCDDGTLLAVTRQEGADGTRLPTIGERVRLSWRHESAVPLEG